MKITTFIFSLGVCGTLVAKDSQVVIEALQEYRSGQTNQNQQKIAPREMLSSLLDRIKKNPDLVIPPEEILLSLAITRDNPSANLVKPLKEIWSHYRRSTYRAIFQDDWRYVKSLDFSQAICDEIKILVKKMGGSLDDIEPLEERNTYDLNQIRTELNKRIKNSREETLPQFDMKALAKRLSAIVGTCKFASENEDQKLHMFYFLLIVKDFENKSLWPDSNKADLNDPIINFYDETLTKCLSNIDDKWMPNLAVKIPDSKKLEEEPSAEQIKVWKKESLKGYQQTNLRNLRDQVLTNIVGIIAAKKGDEDFKQGLLKRFTKNEECANTIKARLDTHK